MTAIEAFEHELRKSHPMTREQEKTADVESLVRCNLRFAYGMAKQFKGHGVPISDLVCAANEGLLMAARKFDPAQGTKFITYAIWWIRQRLHEAVLQDRTVHIPLCQDASAYREMSLDEKLFDEPRSHVCLMDSLVDEKPLPDEVAESTERDERARALFARLKPREAQLLERLFLKGWTLEQAGAAMGVSRERARQLRNQSVDKLRVQAKRMEF